VLLPCCIRSSFKARHACLSDAPNAVTVKKGTSSTRYRLAMALSELPVNHIGRNGRAIGNPPDSPPGDIRYTQAPSSGLKAGFRPNPSSIQSMLKNTTEVGDIGELAFQPRGPNKSRMKNKAAPRFQQTPPPRPSGSIHSSVLKYDTTNSKPPERSIPYSAMRSQQSTISGASSIYSMYRNRSETSFRSQSRAPSRGPSRGPSHGSEGVDEESYFTIQHSSSDRTFASHSMVPSFQLRSQAELHNIRPKSPFAYPTRLKRPGYRPSSPALSDAYRSAARTPHGFQPATTSHAPIFRTVSPLSVYSVRRSPNVWQQGPNWSDPMLSSQQRSPKERYGIGQYGRIDQFRAYRHTPVPVAPEMYPSIDYVSTADASVQPLFYDYSEDFQQESLYHASGSIPVFDDALTQPDSRRMSYYELGTGNENCVLPYVAELSGDIPSSGRNSARGLQSSNTDAGVLGQVESDAKRVSHNFSIREAATRSDTPVFEPINQAAKRSSHAYSSREISILSPALSPLESADDAIEAHEAIRASETYPSTKILKGDAEGQARSPSLEAAQDPPSVRDTVGHRILSSYKRSQEFLAAAPNRTIGTANVSLYSMRSRSSSSSAESMYSVRPAPYPEEDRKPKATLGLTTASPPTQREDASAPVVAQRLSFDADQAIRPQTAQTEIHSPVPKRSMSSPSHRERFSSILSIDEGLLELDELAETSIRPKKARIASTFAKANSTVNPPESSQHTPSTHYSSQKLQDISEAQSFTPINGDEKALQTDIDVSLKHNRHSDLPSDVKKVHEGSTDASGAPSAIVARRVSRLSRSTINLLNGLPRVASESQSGRNPAMGGMSTSGGGQSKPNTMKELPLRPRSSVVSVAPPHRQRPVALPFSFTPLRPEERDHDTESVTELGKLAASYLNQAERSGSESSSTPPKSKPKERLDRTSVVSTLRSRLAHVDAEPGRAEGSPKVELTKIAPDQRSIDLSPSTMPRFKLKVHRASSSPAQTTKITKPCPSADVITRPSDEGSTVRYQGSSAVPSADYHNLETARQYFHQS